MPDQTNYQDLVTHSDRELAQLLGTEIIERLTIHEWPLSRVQKLYLGNGTKLIYKSQLPPTVEVEFYENARSELLPKHKALGKLGNCDIMILDWIEAPLLTATKCSANDIIRHGQRIVEQISAVKGEPPTYIDIGSIEAWLTITSRTLERLMKIIKTGRFNSMDSSMVEHLVKWTRSDEVLEKIIENPSVTHGDLKSDQIFMTASGYRIIDWQRPVMAHPDIDLVSLLVDEHIDPFGLVHEAVIGIFWFLRLRWAVEAEIDLFPGNKWNLFGQWASEATKEILKIMDR